MSCESRQTCYATVKVIPCSRICHLCFPFMHNFKQDLLEFAVGGTLIPTLYNEKQFQMSSMIHRQTSSYNANCKG